MEATMLLPPAVFLPGRAPTQAPDQYDRLLEAAVRLHLRPLPDQTAEIDWAELRRRLERRQKADENPPADILDLRHRIADLRRELEELDERLKPRPVTSVTKPQTVRRKKNSPATAAITQPQPRRIWTWDAAEADARQKMFQRRRELPEVIYRMEKELERISRLPKCELHLRGLLFRPGLDYADFNRDPEEFDLQLQGLLPQLQEDELFTVFAEVKVEGRTAMELYGSEETRVDCRPFLIHTPREYDSILRRAACKTVLFCGLHPRVLI